MSPQRQEDSDVEKEAVPPPGVIPLYHNSLDRAIAPFTASGTRRLYIRDPGPPDLRGAAREHHP